MWKFVVVSILLGSDSDLDVMQETVNVLKQFGVSFDIQVLSAHRSPELLSQYMKEGKQNGTKVFIAAAGGAAHLAGAVAAQTTSPVIGVPINATSLDGLDSLLSTVQMPPGVPVATVAIGKFGAANAGYLAVQILALSDPLLASKLEAHKKSMVEKVKEKNASLKQRLGEN